MTAGEQTAGEQTAVEADAHAADGRAGCCPRHPDALPTGRHAMSGKKIDPADYAVGAHEPLARYVRSS